MKRLLVLGVCIVAAGVLAARPRDANAEVVIDILNTSTSTTLGTLNVTRGATVDGYQEIDLRWLSLLGPAAGSTELNLGGTWTALGSGSPTFYLGGTSLSWKGQTCNLALSSGTPPAAPQTYINMDSQIGTFLRGPQSSGTAYGTFTGIWYVTPGNYLELTPMGGDMGGYDTRLLAKVFVTPGAGFSFVGASGFSYGGGTTPNISFTVAPVLPGDANGDGVVDEADAVILAANWQTDGGATWADGDFNGDDAVDDYDATLLAANWRKTSSGTASVPEPTAGLMILLGIPALLGIVRFKSIRRYNPVQNSRSLPLLLFFLSSAVFIAGPAYGVVLFEDNFDSGTLGSIPDNPAVGTWAMQAGSVAASIQVTDSVAPGAVSIPNYLSIVRGPDNTWNGMLSTFERLTNPTDLIRYEVDFYGTPGTRPYVNIYDGTTELNWVFGKGDGGIWIPTGNGIESATASVTYNLDAWNHLVMDYQPTAGTFDFSVNGNLQTGIPLYQSSNGVDSIGLSNVVNGPGGSGALYDNVRITLNPPRRAIWTGIGGTTWSTAAGLNNWQNSGGTAIDYSNGDDVTFDDTAIGVTADISAADVAPAGVAFDNTAKNFTVLGSKGIAGIAGVTKQGSGKVTLNSVNTYGGPTTVQAGTLQLGISAQSPVLTGGGADIQYGKIVLDYTGGSTPAAAVQTALTASHASGFASGQIKSTTADTTYGLGWVDDAGTSQLTIARTMYGDADLDGSVGLADLTKVQANWGATGKVWSQGDFNYDGAVDLADLTKVQANDMRVRRSQLAWQRRRVIYNDDGWGVRPYTTPAQLLDLRVRQVTDTQVDSIAYCTGGGGVMWAHQPAPGAGEVLGQYVDQSSPADAIYLRDGLIALKNNFGTDPLAVVVDYAHQNNQEVFWSYRMNNAEDSFADYTLSTRKRQHPEYLMGVPSDWSTYPISDPKAWWTCEDFANPAVRDYVYELFNDVSHRYDVDGIELDFLRHPMFFRPNLDGQPATSAQVDMMTDLVRSIRAMSEQVSYERGRPLLVSIRTPLSVEKSLAIGLDVSTYLEEHLTDVLVVGNDYAPLAVAAPLQDMVDLGHQYNVPVYALLNPSQESQYNTVEAWRGAAMNRWYWGADGIYTFNLFPTSPDQRFDEIGSVETLSGLDKIYAVDNIIAENALGTFKASLVIPDRLPIVLTPNVPSTAKLPVGEDIVANTPDGMTATALLCLDISSLVLGDELELDINGYSLTVPAPDQPLTSEPGNATYYLDIDPALVQPGYNLIDIQLIPAGGAPPRTPVLDALWLAVDYNLAAGSQSVPEPGTGVLLLTALIGLPALTHRLQRRRFRQHKLQLKLYCLSRNWKILSFELA